jgi:hypothetical protein
MHDHHVARGDVFAGPTQMQPAAPGAPGEHQVGVAHAGAARLAEDRFFTGERQALTDPRDLAHAVGSPQRQPAAAEHGDHPVDAGERRERRRLGHVRQGQAPRPGRARCGVRDQLQRGAAAVLPGHAPGHVGGQQAASGGLWGAGGRHGARLRRRRWAVKGAATRLTPRPPGRTLPGMWFNTNVLHQPDVT